MNDLREGTLAHLAVHVAIGAGIILAALVAMHWMRSVALDIAGEQLVSDPANVYGALWRWYRWAIYGAIILQVAALLAGRWVQSRTRLWQAQLPLGLVLVVGWFVVVGLTFSQMETMPALEQAFRAYWNDPPTVINVTGTHQMGPDLIWPVFLDQRYGMSTLFTSLLLFGPPLLLGALGGEYARPKRRPETIVMLDVDQTSVHGSWTKSETRFRRHDNSD
jgi:hypothetical protein